MLFILALVCIALAQEMDPAQVEKEKLAFVERTVIEVLTQGQFPEIFDAKNSKLNQCGCEYNANSIYWGSGVGLYCKVTQQPRQKHCGESCVSPLGENILLICPDGFTHDCQAGCVPPSFGSVAERSRFLEEQVDKIVSYGYDYISISADYLDMCGCNEDGIRAIKYGTQVGFECVVPEEPESDECNGFRACTNQDGYPIMIFCPAGHAPTCGGCQKTLEATPELDDDYDWMVNVLTGYVRESKDVLNLVPHYSRIVDCGCTNEVEKVTYGSGIGHYCKIDSADDVKEGCGPNVICENSMGEQLLHLCPGGFVPTCQDGCGYTWDIKEELQEPERNQIDLTTCYFGDIIMVIRSPA